MEVGRSQKVAFYPRVSQWCCREDNNYNSTDKETGKRPGLSDQCQGRQHDQMKTMSLMSLINSVMDDERG